MNAKAITKFLEANSHIQTYNLMLLEQKSKSKPRINNKTTIQNAKSDQKSSSKKSR